MILSTVLSLAVPLLSALGEPTLDYRWVYVSRSLTSERDLADIRRIATQAREVGLNGMVLSAGLDRLSLKGKGFLRNLSRVSKLCREKKIELIPIIFSVGYGGGVLAHNKNLAAGIPVRDALFVAEGNEARFVPDPPVSIENGGMEMWRNGRLLSYRFHDRPGEVSFRDTLVVHSGTSSLRFENFGRFKHGHARVMQEVSVTPHRCYRISCYVKTENLAPESAFRLLVVSPTGRNLCPWQPRVPWRTGKWKKVTCGFNSLTCNRVRVYAGLWGGRSGKVWLDDLACEEVALVNVLRRPGTPLRVRSEKTGVLYQEGRDYEAVRDPRLNFRFDHRGPAIRLLPGRRIRPGERLRVSYWHGMAINRGQVTVCMSERELYRIWRTEAQLLARHLPVKKFFLSMDEIRAGGSCEACKRRATSMAQILGDCVTRQAALLREIRPEAEIFIWSDMLDPNHNAHDKYYLVEGDFTGSWRYVPKDLIIVCWYYAKRNESLRFFSERGFRTLAGAYYDGDTLQNPRGWLDALSRTPGSCGIMYTTWRNKYALLTGFGKLLQARQKRN